MTANAEARALLDQLMGVERDALLPAGAALPRKSKRPLNSTGGMVLPGAKRTKSCYDRDIDPLYCAWGVDVYELFVNTKSDIGPNPNTVDEAARREYMGLPQEEKVQLGFDHRLWVKLQELVQHCDRTVHRNHEKLKRELQRQSQKRGGNDYVVDVSEEKVEELVRAECQLEDMRADLKASLQKLEEVQLREDAVLEEQRQEQKKREEEAEKKKEEAEKEQTKEEKATDDENGDGDAETTKSESKEEDTVTDKDAAGDTTATADTNIVIDREGEPDEATPPPAPANAAVLEELGKLTLTKQELLCTIATIVTQIGPLEENIHVMGLKLNFVRSDTTTDKTVCEVSGNFMSARDADERIAAHYAGKQYVGWKLVRDKFQELLQQYGRHGPPRAASHRGGGGGGGPLLSHQKYMQQGGGGGGGDRYGNDRYGSRGGGGGDRGRRWDRDRGSGGDRWERGGASDRYGGGGDRDRYGGGGRNYEDRRRGGGGYGGGDRDRYRGGYGRR